MSEQEVNKILAEYDGYVFHEDDTLNGVKGVYRKEGWLSKTITDFKYTSDNGWNDFHRVWHKFRHCPHNIERLIIENPTPLYASTALAEVIKSTT
jgi:hypothetical protein